MDEFTAASRWAIAAAASELLDSLDDLYDEEPDSLAALVDAIERHLPRVAESVLGQLASAAHRQLLELDPSQFDASQMNRRALTATNDLRLHCAEVWADNPSHEAVELQRAGRLERLLDQGFDVDSPTEDGMTLIHHAIDVEVDAATQTGAPLTVEITSVLVRRGADLSRRWLGKTPLEAAISRGHHLAVEVTRAAQESRDRRQAEIPPSTPCWPRVTRPRRCGT